MQAAITMIRLSLIVEWIPFLQASGQIFISELEEYFLVDYLNLYTPSRVFEIIIIPIYQKMEQRLGEVREASRHNCKCWRPALKQHLLILNSVPKMRMVGICGGGTGRVGEGGHCVDLKCDCMGRNGPTQSDNCCCDHTHSPRKMLQPRSQHRSMQDKNAGNTPGRC